MANEKMPTLLLTGFEPFGAYEKNASWEAVKDVNSKKMNVYKKLLPVEYAPVTELLPKLNDQYKPDFILHCGVHPSDCWKLELEANGFGYNKPDNAKKVPSPESELQETKFANKRLIMEIIESCREGLSKPFVSSTDAGRYLCEFTLFQALVVNENALFLHVPPTDTEESIKLIESIIDFLASNKVTII